MDLRHPAAIPYLKPQDALQQVRLQYAPQFVHPTSDPVTFVIAITACIKALLALLNFHPLASALQCIGYDEVTEAATLVLSFYTTLPN